MTSYNIERRPVRKIPTREQLEVAARRQAAYEAAMLEADPSYSGHDAGLHPEHRPYSSTELSHSRGKRSTHTPVTFDAEGDYELEEDEEYYDTRPHSSVRRYQHMPLSTTKGSVKVVEHYHDQPLRAHRPQLPPPHERYTDEIEQIYSKTPRRIHPLVWIGTFCMFFILGWLALSGVTTWWQYVQNDWKYGQMRHFEINAVVGHNDSTTSPSHFTAENNNGDIYVIELPSGNASKSIIYQITTVPNNTGNPPVTLSFQDLNRDGKPDLIVTIGESGNAITIFLFNNGQKFVSKL